MNKYEAPAYEKQAFNCPHCGVLARQWWGAVWTGTNWIKFKQPSDKISCSACEYCNNIAIWVYEDKRVRLIHPLGTQAAPAHDLLPAELVPLYREAQLVFSTSPRAAAGLLRVLLSRLMPYLGLPAGSKLAENIGALAKKGLPPEMREIMDKCRASGKYALLPGQIAPNENPQSVQMLFEVVNFLVAEFIEKPAQLKKCQARLQDAPAQAHPFEERRVAGRQRAQSAN